MTDQPLLRDLKAGEGFQGHLLALEATYRTSRTGSEYLETKLADASGELKGLLWDVKAVEGSFDAIRADAFLKVKAKVEEFQGRLQLRLEKVKAVEDAEVGDLSRFFPSSKRPVGEMLAELDGIIASVRDPWIRGVLEVLLVRDERRRAAFAQAPAAKSMHHAYRGGLLEHSLSIAAMAERACGHYREMNRDLVMAGVFLHDLGKTEELTYARSFGYSDEGNLLGHISMEAQWIQKAIDGLPGFPEMLRLHLLHIVLSHHGRLEYGSPVLPKTPEALLVHTLDDLDGKLEVIFRSIHEDAGEGAWTPYQRALDRTLFKGRWPAVD